METYRVIDTQVLTSPAVLQFVDSVRAFCDAVDQIDSLSEAEFLQRMQTLVPLAYSQATELEWPWHYEEEDENDELMASDPEPELEVPHGGQHDWWKHLRNVIGVKLSWHRFFHFVYNPVDPNDRAVIGADIADCLADIYIDLKENLMLHDRGSIEDRAEAIWKWKGSVHAWGTRAAEVMLPIHHLLQTHYPEESPEDDEEFRP